MNNQHKTWFISDLHLDANQPLIAKKFFDLLTSADESVDALYILGDLFEAWIGDDDNTPFHLSVKSALKTATQRGLPIYLMRGNRDFLIGKRFLKETGCHLLPDEKKIKLYGQEVVIMHGDTLCTKDIAYLKARRIAFNPLFRFFFSFLTLTRRKKIAANMRAKSKRHTTMTANDIMDVTEEAVLKTMQKYHVNYLIHGHTHRPATHTFSYQNQPLERIVLGAWHERGNMLIWTSSGKKNWIEF